jgi:hypothetical protein
MGTPHGPHLLVARFRSFTSPTRPPAGPNQIKNRNKSILEKMLTKV